jgi:hypothetical protein
MKGPDGVRELENAAPELKKYGGTLLFSENYTLPGGDKRCLIAVQKTARTIS